MKWDPIKRQIQQVILDNFRIKIIGDSHFFQCVIQYKPLEFKALRLNGLREDFG